jgi:MATE family multidrug resistance protein
VTVIIYLTLPEQMIALFIDPNDVHHGEILAYGIALMGIAALFQVVDAIQIMALGLLRGVQDTKVPMIFAAISYWVLGMPASYYLGFTLGWGGPGIWMGLVVGLFVASILLMARFWLRSVHISRVTPTPA